MHTIVISDLHLSDAEPINSDRPLWKKFRQKQYFIDQEFHNFINKIKSEISSPKELKTTLFHFLTMKAKED